MRRNKALQVINHLTRWAPEKVPTVPDSPEWRGPVPIGFLSCSDWFTLVDATKKVAK